MAGPFKLIWKEDCTNTIYARVTAPQGTGAATGIPGEGNWVKQADLASIGIRVFNTRSTTPDTPTVDTTLVIATVILDTPVTSTANFLDPTGHNLVAHLPPSYFPAGGHIEVELTYTLTAGLNSAVGIDVFTGPVRPVRGS